MEKGVRVCRNLCLHEECWGLSTWTVLAKTNPTNYRWVKRLPREQTWSHAAPVSPAAHQQDISRPFQPKDVLMVLLHVAERFQGASAPQCKALKTSSLRHITASRSFWTLPVSAFSTYSSREDPWSALLSVCLYVSTHLMLLLISLHLNGASSGWINRFLSDFRIQIASWWKLMDRSCTLWRGWMATSLTNRIQAYLKIKEISTKAPQVPSTKLSAFFFLKFALYLAPRKAAAQNCGSDIIINLKVSDIYVWVQRGTEVEVFDSPLLPARCFISPNCSQLIVHPDKWCMGSERWLLWLFSHTLYKQCVQAFLSIKQSPKIS